MTAETTFPLHPECEATLAANPGRVYLFDLTLPARAATAEEVAEYGQRHTDPKWRDLYRFAGYTGHAEAAPPVAASLPDLQVGETAARLEATVAAYEAGAEVASSIARGIGEAGVALIETGTFQSFFGSYFTLVHTDSCIHERQADIAQDGCSR